MIRRLALVLALVTSSLAACSSTDAAPAPAAPLPAGSHAITVDGSGYHPASITLPAGQPATLVFTRTSDDGCGQQLVFPTLNIRKDLPLDQPVTVTFTPTTGETRFTCGMDMYRGTIVAQ